MGKSGIFLFPDGWEGCLCDSGRFRGPAISVGFCVQESLGLPWAFLGVPLTELGTPLMFLCVLFGGIFAKDF